MNDPALTQRFYDELRRIAERAFRSERAEHTLQPTAVVNEACVRLLTNSTLPDVPRAERLALAARVMRQVLVDHERRRRAEKRGGGRLRIALEAEDELASPSPSGEHEVGFEELHVALERLRALHERQAEVVQLKIFGGTAMQEIAAALGVAVRTVEADWTVARAWLRRELAAGHDEGGQ